MGKQLGLLRLLLGGRAEVDEAVGFEKVFERREPLNHRVRKREKGAS